MNTPWFADVKEEETEIRSSLFQKGVRCKLIYLKCVPPPGPRLLHFSNIFLGICLFFRKRQAQAAEYQLSNQMTESFSKKKYRCLIKSIVMYLHPIYIFQCIPKQFAIHHHPVEMEYTIIDILVVSYNLVVHADFWYHVPI